MKSWHFTSKSTLVHLIETLSMALEKICHDSTLSLLSSILYPKGKYYKNMLIARFPFITRIQTRKHSNASSITQATTGLIGAPWIEETRRWKTTCGFQTKMGKSWYFENELDVFSVSTNQICHFLRINHKEKNQMQRRDT